MMYQRLGDELRDAIASKNKQQKEVAIAFAQRASLQGHGPSVFHGDGPTETKQTTDVIVPRNDEAVHRAEV